MLWINDRLWITCEIANFLTSGHWLQLHYVNLAVKHIVTFWTHLCTFLSTIGFYVSVYHNCWNNLGIFYKNVVSVSYGFIRIRDRAFCIFCSVCICLQNYLTAAIDNVIATTSNSVHIPKYFISELLYWLYSLFKYLDEVLLWLMAGWLL